MGASSLPSDHCTAPIVLADTGVSRMMLPAHSEHFLMVGGPGNIFLPCRFEEIGGKEKLHNRYVFTDIGGVFFGIGLAEEDEGHRDDVALLDAELYELRWRQYALLSDFRVMDECSI
jgi:hypothetical protein